MELVNALLLAAQLLIGGTNAPAANAPSGVTVSQQTNIIVVTDMNEVN